MIRTAGVGVKQVLASAAAFFILVVLFVSFGTVQADPQPHYLPNESATATPTETATVTATATATATATTDPCTVAPPKPQLVAPKKGTVTDSTTMTFKWKKVECNKRFRVLVKRGSANGPTVWSAGSKKNQLTAHGLARGYTYYWRVRACTTLDICTWSKDWSFKINASNPSPTKTPTPVPGEPTATPVPPGNPPPQIAVYKGPGGYLNTLPNELYRFDCKLDEWAWLKGVHQGQTVYNIDLWFSPNESIKYERLDFNLGEIVETRTLSANSSGYVSFAADTSSWTPDHYHLIFTGKSSGTPHCGHFDLVSNSAMPERNLEVLDHSPEAVERVYRQAGVDLPK